MEKFECLYYFSSEEIEVLEIKKLNLPDGTPFSEVYQWLVIHPLSQELTLLTFKSMNRAEKEESRTFSGGSIKFDKQRASFHFKKNEYHLTRKLPQELPAKYLALIETKLS